MIVGKLTIVGWLALVGCKPEPEDTDTDTDVIEVNDGPALSHTPATDAIAGESLEITVTAVDPDIVEQVTLYFRTVGENAWETVYLTRAGGDVFSTTLPGDQLAAPGLEYYLRAQDSADVPAVTYLPDNGLHPFVLPVRVVGGAMPFVEDFEDAGILGVYDLGWVVESDGFPGYPWEVDLEAHAGGLASALHRRGAQSAPDPLDDWLISPAIDLSSADQIELVWQEQGDFAELSAHSVWISTTSPDPDDGGFEQVMDLPPPGEVWARGPIVDLSDWSGAGAAWVAFRYEGDFADAWWIDDVAVQPMTAELDDLLFERPADVLHPGDAVPVTLYVRNLTAVPTGPLTVTWTVDPAHGNVVGGGEVAAVGGSADGMFPAEVQIAADFPDNTRLPLSVEVTDGVETWRWSESLLVGRPSTATVGVAWSNRGLLQMSVGKGDPAAPEVEAVVVSEIVPSGNHLFSVDLTDHAADLPPGPGPERWWLRVTGALSGQVNRFDVDFDGQTWSSDDLGPFVYETERIFWLPRPPAPVLSSSSWTPTPATPGGTVSWSGMLTNDGLATVGATTVTVESAHPHVVVLQPGAVELAADGWFEGATSAVVADLAIDAAHQDSKPVGVTLIVEDEVESFEIPVAIDVPWPVMSVIGLEVDDAGDADGQLDPGETANLAITLANVGDLPASGTVRCVLAQTGGDATVEVLVGEGSFGTLTAGSSRDEDAFEVKVTSGVAGDSVEAELSCSDGTHDWRAPFVIDLGSPPWRALSVVPDAAGDDQGGGFDFANGWWRTDGDVITFRFDSHAPFDADELFIEAWAQSAGGYYPLYQFVHQGGNPRLRGYDLGNFVTLSPPPTVVEVDEDTIEVTWDLGSMRLLLDRMDVGFAAGFCGGDTYYCDHFADGWGDPYQRGFETDNWFHLTW